MVLIYKNRWCLNMASKKFKFRIDSNNRVGIKEVIARVPSAKGTKITVSMGVTGEFNLGPLEVFENGILTPLSQAHEEQKNPVLYYPIDGIVYICTLTLVVDEGKIKQKEVIVYMPNELIPGHEIVCKRVTGTFTPEIRNAIANNLVTFALSRIHTK